MQLESFNEKTLPKQSGRTSSPRISLGKAGTIQLNNAALSLMKLKPGEKIALSCDKKDKCNWYIYKSPEGFETRAGYGDKGALFNHKNLVQKILDYCNKDQDASHNFRIAGKPTVIDGDRTQYWGILIV